MAQHFLKLDRPLKMFFTAADKAKWDYGSLKGIFSKTYIFDSKAVSVYLVNIVVSAQYSYSPWTLKQMILAAFCSWDPIYLPSPNLLFYNSYLSRIDIDKALIPEMLDGFFLFVCFFLNRIKCLYHIRYFKLQLKQTLLILQKTKMQNLRISTTSDTVDAVCSRIFIGLSHLREINSSCKQIVCYD